MQPICNDSSSFGGSWNADGTILLPGRHGIHAVRAAGGEPTPATKLDEARGETGHRFPHFLPDGEHFLYLADSDQPAL